MFVSASSDAKITKVSVLCNIAFILGYLKTLYFGENNAEELFQCDFFSNYADLIV